MVVWHLCTRSWWWHGTGALDPGGGIWHCTGSWWWHGTGELDADGGVALVHCTYSGGGVALVHLIRVVAWHWCT